MAPPFPTCNILVLTTALMTGAFFVIHGLLRPPRNFWLRDSPGAPPGVWLAAPCVLAGAAILVGNVELPARRVE